MWRSVSFGAPSDPCGATSPWKGEDFGEVGLFGAPSDPCGATSPWKGEDFGEVDFLGPPPLTPQCFVSSHRSASIAAMQPLPAAVMAWRYTLSWMSPATNTPSTLVFEVPGTALR